MNRTQRAALRDQRHYHIDEYIGLLEVVAERAQALLDKAILEPDELQLAAALDGLDRWAEAGR